MMAFYRFKTFKSTYYFPPLTPDSRFIYSLYGNYGGRCARLIWWLFCNVVPFRLLFRVEEKTIEGLSLLKSLLGEDVIYGVNMGTIGPDQKMSVLGYHTNNQSSSADKLRFFAKLSTSQRAKDLSRNEIKVYQALAGTGLVPDLYSYKDTDEYVFLKCECIRGEHVQSDVEESQAMSILKVLKDKHYTGTSSSFLTDNDAGETPIKTCFAHMDFCPWNMLSFSGKLHLIDWEMSAEMPLGFDLFTYLLQTSFLLDNTQSGMTVIEQHRSWIDEYFAGEDWHAYLKAFVNYKLEFFSKGQNPLLYDRFSEMLQSMK